MIITLIFYFNEHNIWGTIKKIKIATRIYLAREMRIVFQNDNFYSNLNKIIISS